MEKNPCEEATIDYWSQKFSEKFLENDKLRSYPEMWLLTVEHASKVAECVRERNYSRACYYIAGVFCWTSGFVNKCRQESEGRESLIGLNFVIWIC